VWAEEGRLGLSRPQRGDPVGPQARIFWSRGWFRWCTGEDCLWSTSAAIWCAASEAGGPSGSHWSGPWRPCWPFFLPPSRQLVRWPQPHAPPLAWIVLRAGGLWEAVEG